MPRQAANVLHRRASTPSKKDFWMRRRKHKIVALFVLRSLLFRWVVYYLKTKLQYTTIWSFWSCGRWAEQLARRIGAIQFEKFTIFPRSVNEIVAAWDVSVCVWGCIFIIYGAKVGGWGGVVVLLFFVLWRFGKSQQENWAIGGTCHNIGIADHLQQFQNLNWFGVVVSAIK